MLLLALAVAACGGSTKSGPTKAEYVAKLDAICKTAAEKTAPLLKQLEADAPAILSGNASRGREVAPVVQHLHEYGVSILSQLRALKQPKGEKAAIERFLSPLTNVVSAAGAAATSLSSGQVTGTLGLLEQVETQAGQAGSAATAYGAGPCGSVVSLPS